MCTYNVKICIEEIECDYLGWIQDHFSVTACVNKTDTNTHKL